MVALKRAELKAAAIHGGVAHGDAAALDQHQIPQRFALAHQGLPLGDETPLRDAGADHLFDEIVAGLPVGLKAPLEKGFELHGVPGRRQTQTAITHPAAGRLQPEGAEGRREHARV
ncbi:hypothetical protein NUITMVA1_15070 [Aeromonas hydrophila]|nr:hypothetical protein NUITMVA1_15070 [Aeromonas hydrophila]